MPRTTSVDRAALDLALELGLPVAVCPYPRMLNGCGVKPSTTNVNVNQPSFLADEWTTPRIEELHLTSNRNLIVRFTGEAEFKKYEGTRADLIREIHVVAKTANLDGDELGYLLGKVAELKGLK